MCGVFTELSKCIDSRCKGKPEAKVSEVHNFFLLLQANMLEVCDFDWLRKSKESFARCSTGSEDDMIDMFSEQLTFGLPIVHKFRQMTNTERCEAYKQLVMDNALKKLANLACTWPFIVSSFRILVAYTLGVNTNGAFLWKCPELFLSTVLFLHLFINILSVRFG